MSWRNLKTGELAGLQECAEKCGIVFNMEDVNPRNIDQLWVSLIDFLDLEISCARLHQLLHECGVESRNGKSRQKMIERVEADAKERKSSERQARQRRISQPLPK